MSQDIEPQAIKKHISELSNEDRTSTKKIIYCLNYSRVKPPSFEYLECVDTEKYEIILLKNSLKVHEVKLKVPHKVIYIDYSDPDIQRISDVKTTTCATIPRNFAYERSKALGRDYFIFDDDLIAIQLSGRALWKDGAGSHTCPKSTLNTILNDCFPLLETQPFFGLMQGGLIPPDGILRPDKNCQMNFIFVRPKSIRFRQVGDINEDKNGSVVASTICPLLNDYYILTQEATVTKEGGLELIYKTKGKIYKSFKCQLYMPTGSQLSFLGGAGTYRVHNVLFSPKFSRGYPHKPIYSKGLARYKKRCEVNGGKDIEKR
jgi:hypothetical protein